jgi:hypothetical protein
MAWRAWTGHASSVFGGGNPVSFLIGVDPAMLAASAGVESAGAASMAAAMGSAGPLVCSVLPPGGDMPSAAAAAGLNARGAATEAMMAQLVGMRALFGDTIGVNGASYAATDTIGQAILSA